MKKGLWKTKEFLKKLFDFPEKLNRAVRYAFFSQRKQCQHIREDHDSINQIRKSLHQIHRGVPRHIKSMTI